MKTIDERFWSMVMMPTVEDSCWLWCGAQDGGGYGQFSSGARRLKAHRWSYERFVREIPFGLVIDHLCRVRNCVNPDHLEAIPHIANVRRGTLGATTKARHVLVTHCPLGHAYTPYNTLIDKQTSATGLVYTRRRCIVCRRKQGQVRCRAVTVLLV